jgi:hypothetical protein
VLVTSNEGAAISPTHWWEKWPALFGKEMAAFERHGVSPKILFQDRGILILEVEWPIRHREPLRVRIGFSPFHPFSRPSVSAPDADLERHQHPISKILCLIPQEAGQWNSNQLVADFVAERIDQLLRTLEARRSGNWDQAAELEEHTPDPLMPYYSSSAEKASIALFDGGRALPPGNCGFASAVVRPHPHPENPDGIELTLERLDPLRGRALGKDFRLPNENRNGANQVGRWVRMNPPSTDDPAALLQAAENAIRAISILDREAIKLLDESYRSVTVILFPDEAKYEDRGRQNGMGCIVLVTRTDGKGKSRTRKTSLIRAEPISDEMFARVPAAAALRDKRILLVGCGAIGSFVSLELARLGIGNMFLWDSDLVRAGNGVRWPMGRQAWGYSKTFALATFIVNNYPWTQIASAQGHVGGASPDLEDVVNGDQNPLEMVRDQIKKSDLVIDATGSTEAQQALAYTCRELGIPYIAGYATLGAAGGVVASFPSKSASCLVCLLEGWGDRLLPLPPVDETGGLVLGGCNTVTFTGASYDLQEVSMNVVRRAVGILSGTMVAKTGVLDIMSLRDEVGNPKLPAWETVEIPDHRKCCGK